MRTITVSGNLGKDPEIRTTQNGTQVANFSMAVRHNRPDENGDYGSDWFRCTVWGNRSSTVERFFRKGSHVVLSGDFEVSEYDGKTQLGINVSDFDLPDNKTDGGNSKPSGNKNGAKKPPTGGGDAIDISDDDLPF